MKRGIALVITLMVAALLSMLALSFLALNRVNLQFLGNSQDQMAATALADTAAEYARMRLDAQPDWGIPSGSNRPPQAILNAVGLTVFESEQNSVVRVVGICDSGTFQLNLQAPGADFQAYQRYNHDSVLAHPTSPGQWTTEKGPLDEVSVNYCLAAYGSASLVPPRSSRRALPAGCANLQIETATSRSLRRIDCTVKRSYLLDSSAMSGGVLSLGLSSGDWNVSSVDPAVNKIRARSKIVTPAASHLSFGAKANAGQALAHDEILLDGSVSLDSGGNVTGILSGQALSTNPALKATTEGTTHGTFNPFDLSYPVPMLTDNQLVAAPGGTSAISKGLYYFTGANEVTYFSNPAADPTGPPDRIYTDKIPDAGGAGTAVFLKDNKFIIPGKVQVDGDLAVNGTVAQRPSLALGYQSDGTLSPTAQAGRLEVKGNVVVRAETVGQGQLIAKSGGGVTMQGNSALSASPSQGVAVYAEGPVHMEPVPPSIAALDFRNLDWVVYNSGLTQINKNTGYTYGNSNTRMDPNQILSWSYQGVAASTVSMTGTKAGALPQASISGGYQSDPFVQGEDSKITAGETRDQVVATAKSDPVVQQLLSLAKQTKIYNSDPLFKSQFEGAVAGYLNGTYDNFPIDTTTTYPIDPGLTLGRYERLKHILIDSEANPSGWQSTYYGAIRTDADPTSWGSFHFGETMYQTVAGLATQASQDPGTLVLQRYLAGTNPFAGKGISPLDILFKGLIYTHQNLFVNTNGHQFSVEGALVSRQGDMVIKDAAGVNFKYNPALF